MVVDIGEAKRHVKPKADSTLFNMRKADLIEYVRTLEHNYNVAVSFNENQAKYIESLGIPEWIPVSERLPEGREDVLVVAFWHEKWNVLIGWYAPGGEVWHVGPMEDTGYQVSHWMPLPEPPAE